jgi:hypothetical protein
MRNPLTTIHAGLREAVLFHGCLNQRTLILSVQYFPFHGGIPASRAIFAKDTLDRQSHTRYAALQ